MNKYLQLHSACGKYNILISTLVSRELMVNNVLCSSTHRTGQLLQKRFLVWFVITHLSSWLRLCTTRVSWSIYEHRGWLNLTSTSIDAHGYAVISRTIAEISLREFCAIWHSLAYTCHIKSCTGRLASSSFTLKTGGDANGKCNRIREVHDQELTPLDHTESPASLNRRSHLYLLI